MSIAISIVIPAYNAAPYIEQCVQSLQQQTFGDIEILVVNDGSLDETAAICTQIAAKDPRVNVISIPNQGVSNARNVGMDNAKGQYLMFVDADDWVAPTACEAAIKKVRETPADILFWPYFKSFEGQVAPVHYLPENRHYFDQNQLKRLQQRVIGLSGAELADPVKTDAFNTPWAKLFDKGFLERHRLRFVERKQVGMEDVLFNIEAVNAASTIGYVEDYLYYYRLDNPHSLTKTDSDALFEKFITLFEKIAAAGFGQGEFEVVFHNRIACSIINIMLSITSPRNGLSLQQQIIKTRELLRHPKFRAALDRFSLKHLPAHWKTFFFLGKANWPLALLALSFLMRRFR